MKKLTTVKRFAKSSLSCTLAVLCAANAVSFSTAFASEPTKPSTIGDSFNNHFAVDAASEDKFTASDYSAERGTVKKHVEL